MLMLNTQAWTIEGLQVFADHADPQQFWYLPGPVQLARRREDGRAELTFIKVRSADAADPTRRGGGFLSFTVDLHLDPELERRVLARLRPIARGTPRLAAAQFDEGTVRVIALDLDSGTPAGGAPPPAIPTGGFRAVERALGATIPSLDAVNRASFSLGLTQEGASIIEAAFAQGGAPVGVIYDLRYTGMRPALAVTITADMNRVFEQFAGAAEAQVLMVRGAIEGGFEKLVQEGAIRIEVHDFIGAADRESKETWALNFFKEQLLQQYFTPSLTVGQLAGGMPQAEGLDAVLQRAAALRPAPTPVPKRPTPEEQVAAPRPAPDPAENPTTGTGHGGQVRGVVTNPPIAAEGEQSPTGHTGLTATAADGSALGSAAAAGLSKALLAGSRSPGTAPGAGQSSPASSAGAGSVGGSGTGSAAGSETGSGKAQAVASFRFRGIQQSERKTLKFEYRRAEATQRSYAPQGFFGLLTADLQRASHFIEVDLDDPFFRVMDIRVSTLADLAAIGLRTVQVSLSHGTAADPGGVKTHDMAFSGQDPAEQSWKVFQNDGEVQRYRYTVQYHFDPGGEWDGARPSHQFGPFESTDRTLVLNPHEHLGFMAVTVIANKIDWGQIDRIDVVLGVAGRSRTLSLSESGRQAVWRVRLEDPAARTVTHACTFVMKDRSTRPGPDGTSASPVILIDDPFPGGLALQLIPILDPARTRMAFVDFEYRDSASGFQRQERYRLAPDDPDREVRVGLPEGAGKAFRYRVTVVPKQGAMLPGNFIETTETLIAVSD